MRIIDPFIKFTGAGGGGGGGGIVIVSIANSLANPGVQNGDLVVCAGLANSNTHTFGTPTGWTAAYADTSGSLYNFSCWYKLITDAASEGSSWPNSTADVYTWNTTWILRGVDQTTPVYIENLGCNGSSWTATEPAGLPTGVDYFVIYAAGGGSSRQAPILGTDPGLTLRRNSATSSGFDRGQWFGDSGNNRFQAGHVKPDWSQPLSTWNYGGMMSQIYVNPA